MKMRPAFIALLLAVCTACSAQAGVLYHISFGGHNNGSAVNVTSTLAGVSVDGIPGDDLLNDIGRSFNSTTIFDSTGVDRGATAEIGGWAGHNPNDLEGVGHAFGPNVPDRLMTTLAFGLNQSIGGHIITIADLDPSTRYKVEWFSALRGNGGRLTNSIAVNGGTAVSYNLQDNYDTGRVITFDQVQLATVFDEFNNARDNSIQLFVQGGNPVSQYVRISAVPEPTTAAAFGIGCLGLLFVRRRRN